MAWHHRLVSVLRLERKSREIDRELAFHVAERIDELVEAGLSREQAEREAKRQFGNTALQKERTRDADILGWLESVVGDLRYAARGFRQSPGYTAVAVLVLAAGIGGVTALFTIVNSVVLRPPLHIPEPDRLVKVRAPSLDPAEGLGPDWHLRSLSFEGVTNYWGLAGLTLPEDAGQPIEGLRVRTNYFEVTGVAPELGRSFIDGDSTPDWPPVSEAVGIVSHGFWEQGLGGDPAILGRAIRLVEGSKSIFVVVVGIMPRGYLDPASSSADLWIAQNAGPAGSGPTVARMRSGIRMPDARRELVALSLEISEEPSEVRLEPAATVSDNHRNLLVGLLACTGILLLLAVINMANLTLSKTTTRGREFALRIALGSGRARLARQVLTESALLTAIGATIGMGLALAGTRVLLAGFPEDVPRLEEVSVDLTVLGFVAAVTLLTTLAFGALPALACSRSGLRAGMDSGTHQASESLRARFLRKAFMGTQLALAGALLLVAATLLSSLWSLIDTGLAFEEDRLVAVEVNVPDLDDVEQVAALARITDALGTLAEVSTATMADGVPGLSACVIGTSGLEVDGVESARGVFEICEIDGNYFRALGISPLRGRPLAPYSGEVVINEAFARRYSADQDALGRRITAPSVLDELLGDNSDSLTPQLVVGLVPAIQEEERPKVYRSCSRCEFVLVRLRDESVQAGTLIRDAIAEADPSALVISVQSVESAFSGEQQRIDLGRVVLLFGAFASLGLVLATGGVYGVAAYSAARRRREVGIRIALGATSGRIVRQTLRDLRVPLVLGVGAGSWAGAVLIMAIGRGVFPVPSLEPAFADMAMAFGGVAALMIGVSIVAHLIPIVRVCSSADPLTALRAD